MLTLENDKQDEEMSLLNHSYICLQILHQLFQNEKVEPVPELTLSEERLFHDGIVESEEIRVDFAKVFGQQT